MSLPGVYHVMTVDAAQPITTQATYMPHGDNSRRLTEVGLQQNDVTVTITHNDVTGALEVEVVEGESTTSVEYPQIVDAGDFSVEFVSENSVVIRDADVPPIAACRVSFPPRRQRPVRPRYWPTDESCRIFQ